MQSLAQEVGIVTALVPQTFASVASGDWVNMENHAFCTVVINTGAVTVGSKVKVQKAKNKSGSSVANVTAPFVGSVYWTNAASTSKASYTKTSVTSSGSVGMISIANSHDSTTYFATIPATVTSTSKAYVNIKINSSTMNGIVGATYLLWGTRYQQQSIPDFTL